LTKLHDRVRKEVENITAETERTRLGVAETAVTMRDLLDDFETSYLPQLSRSAQSSYKDSLGLSRRFFVAEGGNRTVASVRRADVSRFIDWRRVAAAGQAQGGADRGPVAEHAAARPPRAARSVRVRLREPRAAARQPLHLKDEASPRRRAAVCNPWIRPLGQLIKS
jgi:hypothetical protein